MVSATPSANASIDQNQEISSISINSPLQVPPIPTITCQMQGNYEPFVLFRVDNV